jgi:hypothetical protein
MCPQVRVSTIERCAVEVVPRHHPPLDQRRLVEPAAEHPARRRQAIAGAADVIDDPADAGGAAQIEHRRQEVPDFPDVGVRVVETWDERAAAEIDPPRATVRRARQITVVAGGHNPSVANGHRRRHRRRSLRQHPGVVEQQVAQPASP